MLAPLANEIANELLFSSSPSEENLYDSLFINSNSIMLIIHPENGEILDANKKACVFYGYAKHQITKMSIKDIDILSESETFPSLHMSHQNDQKNNYCSHQLANEEIREVEVITSQITLKNKQVFHLIIHDVTTRNKTDRDKEQLISELSHALGELKTLKGIIPICASCKKIRDNKGFWNQVEAYICRHSKAEFSHGICPDCAKELYPEIEIYPNQDAIRSNTIE